MSKKLPTYLANMESELQEKANKISFANVVVFLTEHKPYESPLFAIYVNDCFYGEFDDFTGHTFIDRIIQKRKVCPVEVFNRQSEMRRSHYFRSISE